MLACILLLWLSDFNRRRELLESIPKAAKVGPNHYSFSLVSRLAFGLFLMAFMASAVAQTATLTGLTPSFSARALSRNGKVVVGIDNTTNMAAYWVNGTVTDIPGVTAGSLANCCNADGSVIVGENNALPFIWENSGATGHLATLPLLPGQSTGIATLISADSTTIAGYCGPDVSVWTVGGVFEVPDTSSETIMNSISDDGSTIACDLTGFYNDYRSNLAFQFGSQAAGVVNIDALGESLVTSEIPSFNNNDPNGQGVEDLFCVTSDGSNQYGSSFNLYNETFNEPQGQVQYPESDGFWTVANDSNGNAQLGAFANFEPHSCNEDGSVLGGISVAPEIGEDADGHPELTEFFLGDCQIAFGGSVQDLNLYLTRKGAATANWILSGLGTGAMSADGSVMLGSGTFNSTNENFIATITPSVASLNPDQASFVGGNSIQATVDLDYPAPANTTVTITSKNPGVVPSTSVAVPEGTMLGAFTLASNSVTTLTVVQLTATLGTTSAVANVTVNPVPTPITAFYPATTTVVGGNMILGYVDIGTAAGASGVTVILASQNGNVQLPATVKIPSGKTSASFSITSDPVVSPATATLQANIGSSTQYALINLILPTVSLVRVAPAPVVGGTSTKVGVYLNGEAPSSNTAVHMVSSNPNAQVPSTITVLSGATSANASLTTTAVANTTTVTISATTASVTVTTSFDVNPVVYPAITGFYPSADVIVGGNAATATVTLASAAPTGGYTVGLASNTAGVSVPATVPVAAGKTSASFSLNSTPVTTAAQVTLTATLGTETENTIVTVIPPSVSLVRVAPSPVVGGVSTKVAVYLNGKAPAGGFAVSVSSNSSAATVPATITVPAGATAANATVTTSAVTAATTVVVTAQTGSTTVETTMIVNPLPIALPIKLGKATSLVKLNYCCNIYL